MNKDTGKRYATSTRGHDMSRHQSSQQKKKRRRRHPVIRFLTSLLVCVIVVVVGVFCVYSYYYGMLNYSDGNWTNPSAAANP